MPPPTLQFGIVSVNTYTFAVGLAILVSGGWALHRLRGAAPPGAVADCLLAALVGGLVGARAVHVWGEWGYFREHTAEIVRLSAGGLDWHGAVLGGLLALWPVCWWRGVPAARLVAALAPAIAVIAFGAWWGCWAARCAYGAEVATLADHPAWLVWEAPDIYSLTAPRYRTQMLGLAWSGLLSLGMVARGWRRGLPAAREAGEFWFGLAALAGAMCVMGFLRGDPVPMWRGLRVDQWLDGAVLAIALSSGIIHACLTPQEHAG